MKKLLIFTLSLILVFSFGILASGQDEDCDQVGLTYWDNYMDDYDDSSGLYEDGFTSETDSNTNEEEPCEYTILNGFVEVDGDHEHLGIENRFANYSPFAGNSGQEVAVSIDVQANIPCYLGMTLTGNLGMANGVSVGTAEGSIDLTDEENIIMLFDDEVGGFVDESWNSLGHMGHPDPSDGEFYYLRSCDMFKVDLVANTPYKYSVILTEELANGEADVLPMDVRTSGDGGTSWSEDTLASTDDKKEWGYAINKTLYHDFRVPYTNQPTGQYNGEITFKAATI